MKIMLRFIFLFAFLVLVNLGTSFCQEKAEVEASKDFKTLLTFYRGNFKKGGAMWQRHWNRRVPRDYTSFMKSKVKLAPRMDVRTTVISETETECQVDFRMVIINKWDDTKLNWIYTVDAKGKDSLEAVVNASKEHIVESDDAYYDFVGFFEHFIDSCFVSKCSEFIEKSEKSEADGKLSSALKYLEPIISKSSCHEEAENRRVDLKAKIAKKKCEDILAKANSKIEEEKYFDAMSSLNPLDLNSVCEKDARALWKNLLKKMEGVELKNYENFEKERLIKKFDKAEE